MGKRVLLAILLLSLVSTASALSISVQSYSYIFHCEGDEDLCGADLSENYSLLVGERNSEGEIVNLTETENIENYSLAQKESEEVLISRKTVSSGKPVKITYEDSGVLHEKNEGPVDTKYHFYPKDVFDRNELKVDNGCWRTEVVDAGGFYEVDWYKSFGTWYCIEGRTSYAGGVPEVLNINPISWFGR